MNSLDGVGVLGVGTSLFDRQPEATASALVWTAVDEALRDAEVSHVDAAYVGSVFGEMGVAQRALHPFGIHDVPVIRVENACASGTTAFHEAVHAVASGRYDTVLVVGVEHMTSRFTGPIPLEQRDPHGRAGLYLPSLYALAASRYLAERDVPADRLALVAVKNHANALLNDRTRPRGKVTLDDVLTSRMISDPLTVLQCAPVTDGAAAVVVGRYRPGRRDVRVRASALASGGPWDVGADLPWGQRLVGDVARLAYDQAGVEPADLDVVECHDAFTIGEVLVTESLGLAAYGEGMRLIEDGVTSLDGSIPVNPSGGLLGRGHPLGATGVAQLAEVIWQLRGDAGPRQVEDRRLGLVETMGGGVANLDGNACVVVVLEGASS